MRVLIQKVLEANVKVDNKIIGNIDKGLVLFIGFTNNDNEQIIDKLINKILNLRIFEDESNIMNKSFLDEKNNSILSISQFTLYADTKKGRRPSYINALDSNDAVKLYDLFNTKIKNMGINIQTGKFGADMKVTLTNNGPTTIMLDSDDYK